MSKRYFISFFCGVAMVNVATANILNLQTGPRAAAMGNAFAAMYDDGNVFYANPAGLGHQTKFEFMAMTRNGLSNIQQNDLAMIISMGQLNSANVSRFGAIGVGIGEVDYGNFQGRGRSGLTVGDFEAEDEMLTIAYGKTIGRFFSLGVRNKIYELQIDNKEATGSALDAGFLIHPRPGQLSLGVWASNINSKLSFDGPSEEVPHMVTGGLAYIPIPNTLLITADVVRLSDGEDDMDYRAGVEWRANSVFVLRAGYDTSFDAGTGLSGGFGIIIREMEVGFFPFDRITLDYAFTPADDLGNTNRLGFSVRIGAI